MSPFRWWGGGRHKLFTLAVFVILASLDNTARGVFPPLYAIMARHFAVEESALGLISALSVLLVALTSLFWGYWGDRSRRKPLLLYGTLIWSLAMFLTGLSQSYTQLLLSQLLTAVGVGCIASVGFSVISDFISPARRGLALSLWGLAQGGGGGAGAMVGGLLGAYNWPLPFFVVAGAGAIFALLYLFTFEPERGQAEPELAAIFSSGRRYTHRIHWTDLRQILANQSNRWLMLQVFIGTLASGSLIWMPRLFIARIEAAGYSLETATMAGNLLSLMFQVGFYFAILAGHLGDRWQRRRPDGRAWFCTFTVLATIPFQIGLFFIPLHGLALPDVGGMVAVTVATLINIVTNPWVAGAFVVALVAVAFYSADNPNRSALLTDVNLPEHRGTAVGLFTISTGLGLALGNLLGGLSFNYLESTFASPLNYVIGLSLFQLLLAPSAWCYYQLTKTAAGDIGRVKQTLANRAEPSL
jgi:MFS family permease